MERRTLQYVAEACGGQLRHAAPSTTVEGVTTDSRAVRPGEVFFALKGDRFDAHDFLPAVHAAQAGAAVVARERAESAPANLPLVIVQDPRQALGQLAQKYRRDFSPAMIAVAGSNGKTSTKELIATVLRQAMPVTASRASFNNDIGVPLTLLSLGTEHRAGVIEVGTNHPGELRPLLELVEPSIGVLTSIGREHLEFFLDLDGVTREEGTVAEVLPKSGTFVLNGDCPHARTVASRTEARVVTIGRGAENQWRILGMEMHQNGTTFELSAPQREYSGIYRLGLLGFHQVINATCAVVVGSVLGVGRNLIEEGLRNCRGAKMRMELKQFGPLTVLDDTYNANADSMRAALRTLADYPAAPGARRTAILGDMGELGPHTQAAHEEVGKFAGELDLSILIAIGKNATLTAATARRSGVGEVMEYSSVEEAQPNLAGQFRPGDVVLVKASRSSRLERVVELIEKNFAEVKLAERSA